MTNTTELCRESDPQDLPEGASENAEALEASKSIENIGSAETAVAVEGEDASDAVKELSFEEKVERALKLVRQNPNYRKIFYRILKRCRGEAQPLDDLEQFVDAQPGYAYLKQPPFFPVHWLEQAWALEEAYIDAQGNLYFASDVEDLSEDEFDDLVAQYAYLTTDVGEVALKEANPVRKLEELFAKEPERAGLYVEILQFASSTRSFAEINRFVREWAKSNGATVGEGGIMPNVLVDRLAEADGVVFDEGWQTTEEGKEFLESREEEGE